MKRTKFVTICLALIMILLCLASCGGNQTAKPSTMGKESEATQPQTPTPQTPTPDPVFDDPSMVLVDILPFETEYLGTFTMLSYMDGLADYVRTPYLMESTDDIAMFIDDMDDHFSMSGFPNFSAQYDDAYFKDKILVITLSATSSCCIPSIAKVTYEPTTGNLTVYRDTVHEGYFHNEDSREDFLMVEIPRPAGQIQSVSLKNGDFGTPVVKKYTVRNVNRDSIRFDTFDDAIEYFSTVKPDEIKNEQLKQTVTKILERGYLYKVTAEGYETKDSWSLMYSGDIYNADVDPCSMIYLYDGTFSRRLYINYPSNYNQYVPSRNDMTDYFTKRYDMDLIDLDGMFPSVKHSVLNDVIVHRTSMFYGPIAVKAEIDNTCYLDVETQRYSDAEVNAFIESLQFEKVYFKREQPYNFRTDPNVTVLPTKAYSYERSNSVSEQERPFGAVLFTDAKAAQAYLKEVTTWEYSISFEVPSYAECCAKYDDAFFKEHILIVYIYRGPSCCQFAFPGAGMVKDTASGDSVMTLFIGRHEERYHNDDINPTITLIEVATTEPITDISQIGVKYIAK